jgi:hypothetical protein
LDKGDVNELWLPIFVYLPLDLKALQFLLSKHGIIFYMSFLLYQASKQQLSQSNRLSRTREPTTDASLRIDEEICDGLPKLQL